jgi:hypothetical protein
MDNFEDLLISQNISIAPSNHHHSREGWIQIDCPFCGKNSNKYHMGYNAQFGIFNCWKCGYHSRIDTITSLFNISPDKAKKLFSKIKFIRFSGVKKQAGGKLKIPKNVKQMQSAHRNYLKNRNFNPDLLEELWNLQGIGLAEKLQWRLFIPIYSEGEMVSWTTRSLINSGIRYLSAPPESEILSHKSLLYGEDYARHAIVICEGPADVWKIGPGAVATFGTSISTAQINRMIRYPIRGICFDNENTAQKRAKKLYETLSFFEGRTEIIKLKSKDAGEASAKEIKQIRKLLE